MKYASMVPAFALLVACAPAEPAEEPPVDAPVVETEADMLVAPESAPVEAEENAEHGRAFHEESDAAVISITLPEGDLPEGIGEMLLARSSADVPQFRASAEREAAEAAEPDGYEFRAWTLDVDWENVGPAEGPLRSYRAVVYVDEGGVHPNHEFDIVNYDLAAGREIGVADLFADLGVAMDTLSLELETALMEAKRERLAEYDISEEEMLEWVLPATEKRPENFQNFTLTATEEGDAVAGLTFYYGPYDVGAYAEGSYTAFVPASAIYGDLAPVYQGAFKNE
ncbi:MAG: RsiV family protein [Hyphomonadaceae bacterium]|nr:RsiV family protein [Hyphomonadaceae bacterium]